MVVPYIIYVPPPKPQNSIAPSQSPLHQVSRASVYVLRVYMYIHTYLYMYVFIYEWAIQALASNRDFNSIRCFITALFQIRSYIS